MLFVRIIEGRTYRQPEVVFISLPQVATGLRYACRARSVGGHFMQTISWRPALQLDALLRRERFCKFLYVHSKPHLQNNMPDTAERGKVHMAIFHFTIKIVGRSKGKSVISASAYLNGDVMKNEETEKVSYYTSKKEVVYTSLVLCDNAPSNWLNVPEENLNRFMKSVRYKQADNKSVAIDKFKTTFQKQRLWNEVLKIEKGSDSQLARAFEFSLPKEWNREEQITYTTDYINRNFVAKGMCADWSIHDKGDGNPHVHMLLTMRPFNNDRTWGNKEIKDWEFVKDEKGNIVIDEADPNWWQDKKNPDRHGIRIPVFDINGNQKVDSRNRKQWKRTIVDATGWNNPKNCELWRSEWAKQCNLYLKPEQKIDHRSFQRQGRVDIPTIHEGADARKIEAKFIQGQTPISSWKVQENQVIKRQNAILQKLQNMFGKVSNMLKIWKETLNDIRRKQRSNTYVGRYDKSHRRTAEYVGRDVSSTTREGQEVTGVSGTERHIAEIKQRVTEAIRDIAKYRRNVATSGISKYQNLETRESESRVATIGREIEQREQIIAGTEQRIVEAKQKLEKVRDVDERINRLKARKTIGRDIGVAGTDARRDGAEGATDSRASTAAERIAGLKREAQQREQSRERTSIKERLESNKKLVEERERSGETSRSNHRRSSR